MYNEAIAAFMKALESDPNLGAVHYNLALYSYALKNYELAIKHIDKAIELGVKVPSQFLKLLKPYRSMEGRK